MKTRLFLFLAAALTFAACSEDAVSDDVDTGDNNEIVDPDPEVELTWEEQYTYNDIGYSNRNFTVEFESEDWELTGRIFFDGEAFESSEIYDYFTEYVSYNSADVESISYPLTDSRMALMYGTIDGSSTEEIIAANGCDITITKSSATELYLGLGGYNYIDVARSISIELNYEGELKYVIANQKITSTEDIEGGAFISTIRYSTLNLTFGSEGGSYTLKLIPGGTHTLPDTVGKVGSIFLYTKSLYDYFSDPYIWYNGFYPSTEEYSEPLELTYGYVGDSTTE